MRFVCPTYEKARSAFAAQMGLHVEESWWLLELGHAGGAAGVDVSLPGAEAITVEAPPGPTLFLPDPTDAETALPAALDEARRLGCATIVVDQAAGRDELALDLRKAGLRRHCDFFNGRIHAR